MVLVDTGVSSWRPGEYVSWGCTEWGWRRFEPFTGVSVVFSVQHVLCSTAPGVFTIMSILMILITMIIIVIAI